MYCPVCNERMDLVGDDGEGEHYRCSSCGHSETIFREDL